MSIWPKRFLRALPLVLAGLAAGCASAPLTLVPSNVPVAGHSYKVIGPVEGQACFANILGICPFSTDASIHTAEENALRSAPGADALVDISIDREMSFYIIYNSSCTTIHAKAVKFQ